MKHETEKNAARHDGPITTTAGPRTTAPLRTGASPRRRRATARWLTAGVAVMTIAACGSDGKPSTAGEPSAPASATAPAGTAPAGTSAYSTRYFTTAVDLAVPSWLELAPAEEAERFVTWASSDGSRAVRILSPVVVYPPGSAATAPVPDDYVAYLTSQADHGGHLTDREDTSVDGHPATVVTATTDQPLDGSLGCPEVGVAAPDCFGLQPDLVLRIAVVTTDQGPLLIWLRNRVEDQPDMTAEAQRFDALLAGIRFSSRAPEPVPVATESPLDGVYEWTLTKDDALAHGTPGDQAPDGLRLFPNTFTVTLEDGRWDLRETSTTDRGAGTYEATDDHIDLHEAGTTMRFDVAADADGTLHLTAAAPMDPGTVFAFTTKPWTRK
jgi:hypothetical protein